MVTGGRCRTVREASAIGKDARQQQRKG
jgi:hypothetical protein